MIIPENDTSTGSLEIPDAPRNLCTRNRSSVQPYILVLRIDGFMHEAILLNATPYQLSWFCTVPNVCPMSFGHATRTGTLRECPVHLFYPSASLGVRLSEAEALPVRLCQVDGRHASPLNGGKIRPRLAP